MIVDLHAHFLAPELVERLARGAGEPPAGVALEWSVGGSPRLWLGGIPSIPMPPGMDDLEGRRAEMARQGVDAQWLTPWVSAVGYELDAGAGAAWSRLVNETTAAALRGQPGFWGAATVPLQDGRLAAAELERAAALGLKGAIIGTHAAGKSLDDPDLAPFWATAEALGAPVLIHPFGIPHGTRLERYHLQNLVGNPADTTVAAAQLVFGGVCDRHPDLRVLLVHGGGFFPYQAGRWDRGYVVRKEARGVIGRPPSDYLRWFYYDTVTHGPAALSFLVGRVGADRVALGTDYPFDMADPDPRRTVREADLDAAGRVQVEERTAVAFLGLGR